MGKCGWPLLNLIMVFYIEFWVLLVLVFRLKDEAIDLQVAKLIFGIVCHLFGYKGWLSFCIVLEIKWLTLLAIVSFLL